jgi:hypothetical protein
MGERMPQERRLEVAGVNVRIVDESRRDYMALFKRLFDLRQIVKFYGSDYFMITQFIPGQHDELENLGVFSRFAQIDPDAGWLDLERLRTASRAETSRIQIPPNLRPNHRPFYFSLVDNKHFVVFEILSSGETLSPRLVAKCLTEMMKHLSIMQDFGVIEVDMLSSKAVVDDIIRSPSLKQLDITVKRTNQDDVGRDWIEKIDRDLKEQRLRREERKLYAEPGQSVQPSDETAALARYASETGRVDARIAYGRATRPVSTEDYPETEHEEFPRDVAPIVAFSNAVRRFVDRVVRGRDEPFA